MPRFRVMLRCDSAQIVLEDKRAHVGFFTTRAADADTPQLAAFKAVAAVRRDLRSRMAPDPGAVRIVVETISAQSWWWRRFRRPAGFTFFLTGPADTETDAERGKPA